VYSNNPPIPKISKILDIVSKNVYNFSMAKKKELFWVGTSLKDLKGFPYNARQMAGYQLDRVQGGDEPSNWKPMNTVGAGVKEIRIKDDTGAYRVFYVAVTAKGVYVLHAFKKKTQATELKDIRLANRRYREVTGG